MNKLLTLLCIAALGLASCKSVFVTNDSRHKVPVSVDTVGLIKGTVNVRVENFPGAPPPSTPGTSQQIIPFLNSSVDGPAFITGCSESNTIKVKIGERVFDIPGQSQSHAIMIAVPAGARGYIINGYFWGYQVR